MNLPTLYKKTSTGAIEQWRIWVIHHSDCAVVWTEHGQVGGKLQTTSDTIRIGKNFGKANETTPFTQAELEAKAKWTKQLKKGYVKTIKEAEADKTDAIIEGGVVPMLAKKYADDAKKIKWPAFVQPKLDGIRCIATVQQGTCTLWTRTRKPIRSVPHIVGAIERMAGGRTFTLDGELYNHSLRDNFNRVIELVRPDAPVEGHETVQYHVYDYVEPTIPFERRHLRLIDLLGLEQIDGPLVRVQTVRATHPEHMEGMHASFKSDGYEGTIVRNAAGLYVNKRSADLQKRVDTITMEFPIVGVEEGKGKLQGHVATFVGKLPPGHEQAQYGNWGPGTFGVKMEGETAMLKRYWEDHSLWKGKEITVDFRNWTPDKSLRFPVGICVRDYE